MASSPKKKDDPARTQSIGTVLVSKCAIAYDLGKHGWSSFTLTIGDHSTDIGPFGYCTDALGDFVRAALTLATSGCYAKVRFDGEPCEFRLIVDEDWKSLLRLRILRFENGLFGEPPEEEGEVLIKGRLTADDFARAVQNVAHGIWNTYGAAGYDAAWRGQKGFPLRALRALDTALAVEEPLAERQAANSKNR